MKFILSSLLMFLSSTVLAQSVAPAPPAPLDIASLLKDARANGKNAALMSEYTYNWKITQRGTDRKGAFKDSFDIYETYVPTLKLKGTTKWVLIKTHENSQPLPAEKVEKERLKAGEKLLKAELESQRMSGANAPAGQAVNHKSLPGIYFDTTVNFGFAKKVSISLDTLLGKCQFEFVGEESLNDRPTIKLKFRPPATDDFSKEENFLARAEGNVWIDKADRIVVKVEGWPRHKPSANDGLAFIYQNMRVPEGKWLPRLVQFFGIKNKDFFNGMGGDMIFEWLDYKHFVTDAEDAKLKPPQ